MKKKAFTLIELLVVIAIIALLLAVILPALNSAKAQAQGVICTANLSSVLKCWLLYAQNNGDEMVGNLIGPPTDPYFCWVEGKLNTAGNPVAAGDGTWQDEVRGLAKGLLSPYTQEPKIFHCPGDKRYTKPPTSGGTGDGGYRSYSLIHGAGVTVQSEIDYWKLEPVKKLAAIRAPGDKYVFVEEMDGRGMNVGSWVIQPQITTKWVDPISIWHVKSSTLGFADGHAEKHKWRNPSTKDMAEKQLNNYVVPTTEDHQDLYFMLHGYPYARILP
jgi:prepilin-type N-terminal cleavage/methylation domain-containing protein